VTLVRTGLAALLALAFAVAPAAAEERGAGAVYDRATYPYGDVVDQPLTLPRGMVRLDVPVHVNLTTNEVGKPWFIPPSLDVGVTDGLQLGVFSEVGLCPAGAQNGCNKTWDDLGARAVVSLARTRVSQLAVEADVLAFQLDDPQLRAGLALDYKRSLGVFGFTARAGADAFVTDRDTKVYRELAFAEVLGALQLGDELAVIARVRGEKALEVAAGTSVPFRVPVELGFQLEPVRHLSLGASIEFQNLLGEEASADQRMLIAFARLTL
jgi:hypothetical protein